MAHRYQVIIVGGGPVGVALAVELGLRGISCGLVERRVGLPNIPKGQNLTQRTLEHFYFWGIVDELRAARVMPPDYPIAGITAYDNLMGEYWISPPQREVVRDYYFQANDRLPQYEMERILRQKMADLPSVESRMGWTAETIEQNDDGVSVTISETDGSESETWEGEYLVGCDGAHSMVRDQVGIVRSGSDFEQLMMLAVFRSRALHEGLKRFPEKSTYNALHPDAKGLWQFFGRIDVGEGWFFHAPVPADTTRDNYDFQGHMERAAGFQFEAQMDHVGFWPNAVSVADQYQVGRVFIAGDAAHSHPPYGGFGLNNGLEDVTNLGWKLAAKLNGWGSEALLNSYGEERHPIFKETGEDFIAARIRSDRDFLANYSPEKDKAAFEAAWAERGKGGMRAQNYEPNYEGSSVVMGPSDGVCTAHGVHNFLSRTGHHLPPQPLSSGRNVFEELGAEFTLLAFGVEETEVAPFEAAAKSAGVPLKVIRDSYDGGREQYEAKLSLLRPDQYVVWNGDTAPADAGAVMARVAGS